MCSSGGDVLDRLAADAAQLASDPAPYGPVAMGEVEALSRVIDLAEAAVAARVGHVDADKAVKWFGFGSTSAWLRQSCGMRSGRAAERTMLARQLRRLPEVAKRFAAGDLGYGPTAAICHAVRHLSDEHAAQAEPILLELAGRASPDVVAKAGAYLRRVLDPDGSLGDDDKGFERRWFSLAELTNGGSHVEGVLDPELTARLKPPSSPSPHPRAPTTPGHRPNATPTPSTPSSAARTDASPTGSSDPGGGNEPPRPLLTSPRARRRR
ncbi:MAG: DUF222 domain-containing protein [Streptosporangiaceae bacterium]